MLFILLCLGILLPDLNHDGIPDMVQSVQVADLTDLGRLARAIDVAIVTGALPAGWLGAWCHKKRRITMKPDLPSHVFRSVLAHELGHAHMGHVGYHPPESLTERAADRFAAKHLIRMDDYHAAMATHGNDAIAIARELGVMPWVVREFGRTMSGGLFSRVAMGVEPLRRDDRPLCSVTGSLEIVTAEVEDDVPVLILGNNVLR